MTNHKTLSVYKKKNVLVTGDTGFKGSWLSLWLHYLGANVIGYALPPKNKNDHFNLIDLSKIIHHIDGDIRDLKSLKNVVDDFKVEFLFHLAAQPLVGVSYKDPKLTLDTNIGGSINILETVRLSPSIKTLVYITSDKCYKNKELIGGYCEVNELGGYDPYSASKASAEIVFASYLTSFFEKKENLGAASTRAGNVIGGGDWSKGRIVPDCIKGLQKQKTITLRKHTAIRPWQHVLEPLYGYLLLGSKLYFEPKKYSSSWNFGPKPDSIHTVKDVAEKIISHWGKGKIINSREDDDFYETNFLQLNCEKAKKLLNWSQKWSFEKTISETVYWYKELTNGKSAISLTTEQIKKYEEE